MRAPLSVSLAALLSLAALGQPPATLSFEAADVHLSPKPTNQNNGMRGPYTGGSVYALRGATMVDLIAKAFGVDNDKVFGGPNWLEYDRFDLRAKFPGKETPAKTAPEAAKSMLQTLLADRFKLVVKREERPMPVYILKVASGKPKLKESDGSDSGCKLNIEGLPNQPGVPAAPMLNNNCHNMTMAAFADGMRNMGLAAQYINTTPVVDQTGLEGAWDFTFKYSLPMRILPGLVAPGSDTVTLFDSLEKQLGLKLELSKLPQPVIVVESVNQTPSPNAPGVEKSLPPVPTEFEVATLRPSGPDFKGMMLQVQPGGRVNIAGLPVRMLIQQAWGVPNDMTLGTQKWMDSDRYDIVGKVSAELAPSAPNTPVDFDSVMLMLRNLLIDRFQMKLHFEDRPMTAYTLVAAKPKLKKADPSERTKWTNGPPPDGKDSKATPALTRVLTITNMTMAQLADRLQSMAPDYITSPVIDGTGLEGAYDFTLSFSQNGFQNVGAGGRGGPEGAPPPPPGAADAAPASDPNGGITLFEAMEKQLGLKLEPHKRPVQVLVIDHMEQKPVDN
jgi:uncharacterized protein (TIGR03435 family)